VCKYCGKRKDYPSCIVFFVLLISPNVMFSSKVCVESHQLRISSKIQQGDNIFYPHIQLKYKYFFGFYTVRLCVHTCTHGLPRLSLVKSSSIGYGFQSEKGSYWTRVSPSVLLAESGVGQRLQDIRFSGGGYRCNL
jgi:hypothetical protein